LDKSGSMGGDHTTFSALSLAALNSLHPTRGSSLTFFLAGPGETEIVFRRPSDPPMRHRIQLGSSTWFNEPLVRVLTAVSGPLEALDPKGWAAAHGEPPIQVFCITDGADNCSPAAVSRLPGLTRAVQSICGPASGLPMYLPIAGPVGNTREEVIGSQASRTPVWLLWIALGYGGRSLTQGTIPKGMVVVDACTDPNIRTSPSVSTLAATQTSRISGDSRQVGVAQKSTRSHKAYCAAQPTAASVAGGVSALEGAGGWELGHHVAVTGLSAPGSKVAKSAHIVAMEEAGEEGRYTVLLDDEKVLDVSGQMLQGHAQTLVPCFTGPKRKTERATSLEEQQRQVMQLVDAVTTEMGSLMVGKPTLDLESCVQMLPEQPAGLIAKTESALSEMGVIDAPSAYPSQDLILKMIFELGRRSTALHHGERPLAQGFVAAVLEYLLLGGTIHPNCIYETFESHAAAPYNAQKKIHAKVTSPTTAWRETILQPTRALLELLSEANILEATKHTEMDVEERSYILRDGQQQVLYTLRRCFDIKDDPLRRCVNRYERMRPAPACALPKSSMRNTRAAAPASNPWTHLVKLA